MRFRPLLRQLLIGMSIRRYLPAMGTAGALRCLVSGYRRVPRPPPRIKLRTSCMAGVSLLPVGCHLLGLPEDAEQVAAENLMNLFLGVTAIQELLRDVRITGDVL